MKVSGVGLEQKEALKVPTMFLFFFRNIRGIEKICFMFMTRIAGMQS
jgi:hypothetical protein